MHPRRNIWSQKYYHMECRKECLESRTRPLSIVFNDTLRNYCIDLHTVVGESLKRIRSILNLVKNSTIYPTELHIYAQEAFFTSADSKRYSS